MRLALIAALALLTAACRQDGGESAVGPDLREGSKIPAAEGEPAPPPIEKSAPTRINAAGLAIIEKSEGLKLEAYPLAGQWLIGYGHAGAEPDQKITKAEAEALLRKDLRATEEALIEVLPPSINENEFSALVSLAYNLGIAGFKDTLVYKRLSQGDRAGAADAFLYLDSARIDGEMKELSWLKGRRKKERTLFLEPVIRGRPQ